MSYRIAVLMTGLALLPAALTGCGSSDSSSGASAAQLEQARQEAAAQQKIKDKQAQLEKELSALKKQKAKTKTVVVTHSDGTSGASVDSGGTARIFHAGSGNVSCRVSSSSASCTVASSGQVFVVGVSGSAYQASGGQLPRGSGAYAPYGTSVNSGSFTCSIPPESQASGITCRNTSTGHGFEASRRAERQKTY